MRVLLVGNYAPDGQHSMLGYAARMEAELKRLGMEVKVIAPQPTPVTGIAKAVVGQKYAAYLDKFFFFPGRLKREKKNWDIIHILDQGNAPYLAHVQDVPHTITIHDLLAVRAALGELPYWQVGAPGKKLQAWIQKSLKTAKAYTCISPATMSDAERLVGIRNRITEVIPNTFYQDFSKGDYERPMIQRYLLHVGANHPQKNRAGAVRIFSAMQRTDFHLVMAGVAPDDVLARAISESPHRAKIHIELNPSQARLAAFYQHAEAVLFPSLDEGLGLPILEAQCAGIPVVTTDKDPMRWVGGEGAIFIDPAFPEQAAQKIIAGLEDRGGLVTRGRQNLARFRTECAMQHWVEHYQKVIG